MGPKPICESQTKINRFFVKNLVKINRIDVKDAKNQDNKCQLFLFILVDSCLFRLIFIYSRLFMFVNDIKNEPLQNVKVIESM